MTDFTITNLRDVEDSAQKFGYAPAMEARFPSGKLGLTESGISLQRLAPGAVQPFGHVHSRQEELFVMVAGSGRIKLDDEVRDVRAWDAVRIGSGVMRGLAAGPDGLEFLVFGAPKLDNPMADVEMERDWWSGA